jgi:hypothetical protein
VSYFFSTSSGKPPRVGIGRHIKVFNDHPRFVEITPIDAMAYGGSCPLSGSEHAKDIRQNVVLLPMPMLKNGHDMDDDFVRMVELYRFSRDDQLLLLEMIKNTADKLSCSYSESYESSQPLDGQDAFVVLEVMKPSMVRRKALQVMPCLDELDDREEQGLHYALCHLVEKYKIDVNDEQIITEMIFAVTKTVIKYYRGEIVAECA